MALSCSRRRIRFLLPVYLIIYLPLDLLLDAHHLHFLLTEAQAPFQAPLNAVGCPEPPDTPSYHVEML
jgi:hypothetical protein